MGEEARVLRRRALVSPRAVLQTVGVRLDRRICRHLRSIPNLHYKHHQLKTVLVSSQYNNFHYLLLHSKHQLLH